MFLYRALVYVSHLRTASIERLSCQTLQNILILPTQVELCSWIFDALSNDVVHKVSHLRTRYTERLKRRTLQHILHLSIQMELLPWIFHFLRREVLQVCPTSVRLPRKALSQDRFKHDFNCPCKWNNSYSAFASSRVLGAQMFCDEVRHVCSTKSVAPLK